MHFIDEICNEWKMKFIYNCQFEFNRQHWRANKSYCKAWKRKASKLDKHWKVKFSNCNKPNDRLRQLNKPHNKHWITFKVLRPLLSFEETFYFFLLKFWFYFSITFDLVLILIVLTAALNNAQTAAEHSQQSAQEAAGELASQQSMVGQAKQRVELIEEQLHAAR